MAAGSPPLISVIIPMHNGAATVERTLASVRSQTWDRLEVIVVDDGSTDDGPDRVRSVAARDPRIQIVRQENAGVAAARNLGASKAVGDYLAFVDADDLWGPDKLARQMQRMDADQQVGLVYTWAALIDGADRIYSLAHRPTAEGQVFPDICRGNVVGNGSSPLIRRSAFERVGGYDSSLRARGAQGCEDLMIYLRIAEHYDFAVVPIHLTGYRVSPENMSSDAERMLRSCELTLAEFRPRYPQYADLFEAHRRDMIYWLVGRALTTGPLKNLITMARQTGFASAVCWPERLGHLTWLTIKARSPLWIKTLAQRTLKQGSPFRPRFLEAQV